jgi:F5/8 type C domain
VTQRPIKARSRKAAISFLVAAVTASLLLGGTFLGPIPSAAGMQEAGSGDEPASGTPVAAAAERLDPLDSDPFEAASIAGDPLDGDPLDGQPAESDPGAPLGETQLEIVRSARPHDEPTTLAVYDDDPQTVWEPQANADETWLWLDLGLEKRLREVRWLSQGTGSVEIAVSNDRERWQNVDRVEVSRGWHGVELRDDARYVRLTLLPIDDGSEFPAIAEAAVYGADRQPSDSLEQRAGGRGRDRDRQSRGDTNSTSEENTEGNASSASEEGRREPRSGGRVRTSAEPGRTRCRSDRDRCEARQGDVSIEADCEREGTCAIDVRADGGTAVCDAAGGDETKAGGGEGKRGGRAGRCEAVANGGAVAVGDVNP